MKHQITTTKGVRKYLYDLIDILYEKEYFGFEEDSIEYVKVYLKISSRTCQKRLGNRLQSILTNTETICFMLVLRKTSRPHGMCFLRYTMIMPLIHRHLL